MGMGICFDSEEYSVSVRPHGNSKKKEKFLQTMPSTIKKLKMAARNLTQNLLYVKFHLQLVV